MYRQLRSIRGDGKLIPFRHSGQITTTVSQRRCQLISKYNRFVTLLVPSVCGKLLYFGVDTEDGRGDECDDKILFA